MYKPYQIKPNGREPLNNSLKEGPRRKRLFIVGWDMSYYPPYASLFSLADDEADAEVVLFTGGADVSPHLYGEKNYGLSSVQPERDDREVALYRRFSRRGLPMLGICRGAQFLTVMSGGKLYQDVSGHATMVGHNITTDTGQRFIISSTHHQMMRPAHPYVLLAWSERRSRRYMTHQGDVGPDMDVDPEIVWYPKTKSLCIQGHPEHLDNDDPVNVYVRDLITEYILGNFPNA
jgi:hypothetical protein